VDDMQRSTRSPLRLVMRCEPVGRIPVAAEGGIMQIPGIRPEPKGWEGGNEEDSLYADRMNVSPSSTNWALGAIPSTQLSPEVRISSP